jgi:hypothetical protein
MVLGSWSATTARVTTLPEAGKSTRYGTAVRFSAE